MQVISLYGSFARRATSRVALRVFLNTGLTV